MTLLANYVAMSCEDAGHFIIHCSALSNVRSSLLALAPPNVIPLLPDPTSNLEESLSTGARPHDSSCKLCGNVL